MHTSEVCDHPHSPTFHHSSPHHFISTGKSSVEMEFVEEDIDYRQFYVPQKQGEVDTLRGKPENETQGEKVKFNGRMEGPSHD